MSNATVVGHGAIENAGADDALFLKLFGGEVLTAFYTKNIFGALQRVRSIASGKSAQFPVLHKVVAAYHTAGTELTGQSVPSNERVIVVDDMLVSDIFVPEIDELKAHYDVRAPYTQSIGEALASQWDTSSAQLIGLAARASANVTGGDGGSQLTAAGYATTGADIAAGIFASAQILDEKDIPDMARYCALRPAQYYLVAQTTNVLNRDWGGSGAYADGTVLKVAGIAIEKTNNVPSTNITSGPAAYQGNFSNTQFLVWQEQAIGTVKLKDVQSVIAPDPRRIGTLIYGKMAIGSDYLRPECAVEGISS